MKRIIIIALALMAAIVAEAQEQTYSLSDTLALDYVMLKLSDGRGPVVTHLTMKAVEDMLPGDRFMRVHRSYIVALDKITSIDGNGDIILGDDLVPVSDSYRKAVDDYLSSHMFASGI